MIDIQKLRLLRGSRKQCEIAEQAGISANHYSQIETGARTPSLTIIQNVAAVLGATVDDILLANPPLPSQRRRIKKAPGAETSAGKLAAV